MARISNGVFTVINSLILILGLVSIGASAYLMTHHSSSLCQKALQLPLFILGVSLFVVSLLGLIGSCCEKTFWIKIYSCLNFLLIVGIICFTIFTFVVTNKGAGKVLSKIGYREYRLGDYSNWLKNHFVNQKNWDQIRSCLIDAHVCHDIHSGVNQQVADFYKAKLSPVQRPDPVQMCKTLTVRHGAITKTSIATTAIHVKVDFLPTLRKNGEFWPSSSSLSPFFSSSYTPLVAVPSGVSINPIPNTPNLAPKLLSPL
ncbi:TETRASPANIN-8 [Salix purpurea]|nr:TETRASPANIN-8 [Salix purpurea]